MKKVQELSQRLIDNIEQVIVGKRKAVEQVIVGLICQGHILIEDVPGVGKTMLARSLSKSLGLKFNRIQCTPDMLPSDITGVYAYNQAADDFEYRPGPLMANIVLADEINRATPKTQAALLEAMQERQVTVNGITHPIPKPFLVLATQNPIEYEGTFPLPEAQLDRFLIKVRLGYPRPEDEIAVIEGQRLEHPFERLQAVAEEQEILEVQELIRGVHLADSVKRYIVEIVQQTRNLPDVYLGASPRGSLALSRTAQARAAMHGRDYVLPDDVKFLAEATLGHRVILSSAARLQNLDTGDIVREVLGKTKVPGGSYQRD
jgi:MoxR-like ATPase